MSDSNQNTPVNLDGDLDSFSADFFGQKEAPEPASSDEVVDAPEDTDALTETDATHEDGEDTPANEEPDDEGEEEAEAEPKPKKTRAQERIEELNKKYRETERQLRELQAKFEEKNEKTPDEVKTSKESTEGPNPADLNEDGSDKYPLGEFDPNYIRDYTRHVFQEEKQLAEAQRVKQEEERAATQLQAVLQESWTEKLGPALERYPDFTEKGQEMMETFSDVDPQYGAYLENTLMQLEYGPDVLYHLASNPDEARKIIESGALKATIALGRLEAKFAEAAEEKQKARPKISNAPIPPEHLNKGSTVTKVEVSDDTDDLDQFSKKFFVKK